MIVSEYNTNPSICSQDSLDQSSSQIHLIKKFAEQKRNHSKQVYQQSKSLKQIQEMVTTLKALINNINQRREMVKEYVVLTEQRD